MKILSIALVFAIAACSSRNKPTKEGDWPEGTSPLTVHPKIDNRIRLANFDRERTPEGQLEIRVTIENRSRKDIAVIAYTDWMDRDGNFIERSNDVPMLLPSGTTKVYEDKSWAARAELFSVSVRPANTKRRTK